MIKMERPNIIAKWLRPNALMMYSIEEFILCEDQNALRELRWNSDKQSSITRKLLNETHGIFMELQELCKEEEPNRELLLRISLQYRAIIQSCIIKLKDKLTQEQRKNVLESMQSELTLFSIIEMIWQLCEILLVELPQGTCCVRPLLGWIRSHFNEADMLGQSIMASDDPYSHKDFWPTVYSFVLQGRLEEVCDLLMHHPSREQGRFDAFASIEDLMNKMPIYQENSSQSVQDFHSRWQQWHSECLNRLNDQDFVQYPEIQIICEILCGVESTILHYKHLLRSWYQLMVAQLLYTDPITKTFHLKQYAVECMEMFNGIGKVSDLDEIILSIMSFDVHKVIEKCSDALPNWWFASHLTDLLFHCGLLKSSNFDYGAQLREFLLQEFSASLMSHSSLWQLAADYLMMCPTNGREHLEAYIERIPLENEMKALKVLNLCQKYGLNEQCQAVCKIMGMKALHRKRLGVALSWCLRAKDEQFASFLTDQFLNHYMETGTFAQCDLIDNLGSSMLLNNKLTFLGKYHEFHKLYIAKKFHDAGSLLVSLLTSNLAPKKFWMILMIDSLPLLEYKEIIFTSEQTYELMHCFTELQICHSTADHAQSNVGKRKNVQAMEEDEKNQLEALNLALTRNLGRALLVQS